MNWIPLGARYMLLSAFAFSIMSVFVKLAGQRIPAHELVTARALVSLVLSFFILKKMGIPIWGNRKDLLIARGTVGFFALLCVYYALTVLPLAEATVIQYLHPIFTALIAMFFLNERPGFAVIVCIVLSFAGLLLVARPAFLFDDLTASWEPLAVTAAVLGALGSGAAYTLVRKCSATEDPLVIVFYFPLIALPGTIPFLMHEAVWPRGMEWIYLLGVGVFTQIGQVALTKGIQLETAARATSFSYLQVVFATLWGVLFFAEIPSPWTLAGALLIVVGTFFSMGDSRRGST
jgi:drug/metabolite transporter (DMT)-like permease